MHDITEQPPIAPRVRQWLSGGSKLPVPHGSLIPLPLAMAAARLENRHSSPLLQLDCLETFGFNRGVIDNISDWTKRICRDLPLRDDVRPGSHRISRYRHVCASNCVVSHANAGRAERAAHNAFPEENTPFRSLMPSTVSRLATPVEW